MRFAFLFFPVFFAVFLGAPARSSWAATQYPITVTDLAGRQVTIRQEPQRIALQDGRLALDLSLLDRADPFARIVVWNNLLHKFSPDFWPALAQRWPDAARIPDMGFDDNGAVNLEEIIAAKPQLVIAELRARPVLQQDHAEQTLSALGIPLLYVDNSIHPVPDAVNSVTLLGEVLNRKNEAQAYTAFYNRHLAYLQAGIAAQSGPHPLVFVEPLAGQADAGNCCFTHGDFGWGLLVQALGARNLGSSLLKSPSGQITIETLLAQQPDVVVMTGRATANGAAGFGYGANPKAVSKALAALENREGFSLLSAVRNGRVYGIYHPFYSSVFNIVGLEYLAKFIYPQNFSQLDPAATYTSLISSFTSLPAAPAVLGLQAPAPGH